MFFASIALRLVKADEVGEVMMKTEHASRIGVQVV